MRMVVPLSFMALGTHPSYGIALSIEIGVCPDEMPPLAWYRRLMINGAGRTGGLAGTTIDTLIGVNIQVLNPGV